MKTLSLKELYSKMKSGEIELYDPLGYVVNIRLDRPETALKDDYIDVKYWEEDGSNTNYLGDLFYYEGTLTLDPCYSDLPNRIEIELKWKS